MARQGCVARVQRQANRLIAEVDLNRALLRQLFTREEAAQLAEAGGRGLVVCDTSAVLPAVVVTRGRGRSGQLDREHGRAERGDQGDRDALTRADQSL
jgi:hypothetical protein